MLVCTVSRPGHTHCCCTVLLCPDPGLLVTTPHKYLPQNFSRFCIERVGRSSFCPEKMRGGFPSIHSRPQVSFHLPLGRWPCGSVHSIATASDLWLLWNKHRKFCLGILARSWLRCPCNTWSLLLSQGAKEIHTASCEEISILSPSTLIAIQSHSTYAHAWENNTGMHSRSWNS